MGASAPLGAIGTYCGLLARNILVALFSCYKAGLFLRNTFAVILRFSNFIEKLQSFSLYRIGQSYRKSVS